MNNNKAQQNIHLNKKITEYTWVDNIVIFLLTIFSILICFFINDILKLYLENKKRREKYYIYIFSIVFIFISISLCSYYLKIKIS